MTISFNHTIVAAKDRHVSARFFTTIFGFPAPAFRGTFASVELDGGVFLQFAEPRVDRIQMQHYAFLVDIDAFDQIYARIQRGGIDHWADPQATLLGQITTNHGGRGVYFNDPAGHGIEITTRPYGSPD